MFIGLSPGHSKRSTKWIKRSLIKNPLEPLIKEISHYQNLMFSSKSSWTIYMKNDFWEITKQYNFCNSLKCVSVYLYLICKLSEKRLLKMKSLVYTKRSQAESWWSDNQNIHQLLHRLTLDQTITNLQYDQTWFSMINNIIKKIKK